MTNTINTLNPEFNTREEYLAYRSAWRAEYKSLTLEIRQLKQKIKEQSRAGVYTDQAVLVRKRRLANQMMQARTAATARMLEQRALAKAVAA